MIRTANNLKNSFQNADLFVYLLTLAAKIHPDANETTNPKERMMITTNQLNQVATLLGTTDKNLVFSVCIKTLVDAGMSAVDAMKEVCGVENTNAMIGKLYDDLRA